MAPSAELVADGKEAMALSCVTELKRPTTAHGKKMGKWLIEDTTSWMPAVVFPESYELMEQVVSRCTGPGAVQGARARHQMHPSS